MAKTITIKFDTFGNTHLDADGFRGGECKEATKHYLAALKSETKDDNNKPEFGLPSAQTTKVGRW